MLEFRETYESSFPRRREFGISMPQEFIGKNQNPSAVIPTKVGMEFQCLKNLSEKIKTLPPSFPRKWESRNEKQQEFIGNDRN
ncbi:hypothetical protein E0W33_03290 [Neisseria meningitidis]|nr:hypothetical protein [Neisseria meningitidis]